jgi:hypothetical protein
LFLYGLCRLTPGGQTHGLAWNVGHTFFFGAFVLYGILTVGLRRLVPAASPVGRAVADIVTICSLVGVLCFLWVTLGDLFVEFKRAAPLPGPLKVGPALFVVGTIILSVRLMTARPRLLPPWCLLPIVAGFVAISADLDLLPIGAVLLAAGLIPVAAPGRSIAGDPVAGVGPKSRM